MQFLSTITVVAAFAASAVAMPNRPGRPAPPAPVRPAPPSGPIFQKITCSSGAPFCCAPGNENKGGTICSQLTGSSISCNGIVNCCNNQGGSQTCSGSLQQPISFVPAPPAHAPLP